MDRFAVFVDAGYLYAGAGKLCCGTPTREYLQLDGAGINKSLVSLAERSCDLPLLRTYWYDGARQGVPTAEQQGIAALPNVKLRLGHLNMRNQQKGVDALIYRDLMTLARERAVSEAYVLSGDADIREGVRTAQEMGVRVTLIGIATRDRNKNQSAELVHEADETITLTRQDLTAFIQSNQMPDEPAPARADLTAEVTKAASEYAQQWLNQATDKTRDSLKANFPVIPVPLDASLLTAVEKRVDGSLRDRDDLRRAARRAFWQIIAPRP